MDGGGGGGLRLKTWGGGTVILISPGIGASRVRRDAQTLNYLFIHSGPRSVNVLRILPE